ncbi:MAG: hypothetical protein JSS63_03605 [Bacteroidetes bacterium]|nr:hypothetical protein [Bacteroidota bacterium]
MNNVYTLTKVRNLKNFYFVGVIPFSIDSFDDIPPPELGAGVGAGVEGVVPVWFL